jgi:hypothetical protein
MHIHQIYHYVKRSSLLWHKMFNNLPQIIKNLSNDTKEFILALKNFLHANSFYSIDEYFNINRE